MNGIELSKAFYLEYGKEMLETEFKEFLPYLAVGFVGSGSEHFGFDDEISKDHDYEPGFCIFLPDENIISRRTAFLLERAYYKLPREYMGIKRLQISPVGGNRNGVIRTEDFYLSSVGERRGNLDKYAWLHIPDYALANATNGEIFFDNYGEFSEIRSSLLSMPEDIRLKRLAGNFLIMAQSGQYNFARCLSHSEPEAAQLSCHEFVNSALKAYFLLQRKYMPFYKWRFRALRKTEEGTLLAEKLSFLLMGDNTDTDVAEEKINQIEEIASFFINILQNQNITEAICTDLEKHAYSVNDHIVDSEIRNLHILESI